jgi:hypothetical protein
MLQGWHNTPDREEAERFLSTLDPSAVAWTFQTFDDDKARRSLKLAHILHGALDRHWNELCQLQAQGAGVFVVVNETDFKGRSAANIVRVRALFVDLDGAPRPKKFHAEPHVVVESSRGRWHVYWLVEGCPLDQFTALQQRLIRHYASDPVPHDLPRVMRLPGFVHQKVKDGVRSPPFRSHLVDAHDRPAYAAEAAVAGLPEEREREKAQGNGQDRAQAPGATPWTAAEEARLRSALDAIPAGEQALKDKLGDSHQAWVNIGRALERLGWGDQGLAIWRYWSARSPKYNEEHLRTNWRSFGGTRDKLAEGERPVTVDTVFWIARQFGWQQAEEQPRAKPAGRVIPAFSTDWCDVKKVARRRWMYGQHYVRGAVSGTVAAGGTGKTALAIAEGICIARNEALLGVPVNEQCKVWYWNGEESREELKRRVHAVCAHYELDPYEVARTFHFTSGVDELPIKIATATKQGVTVDESLIADVIAYIRANDIGVMAIDPLISSHNVPENDNNAMDVVVKAWARVAAETWCSVDLDHHVRKAMRGDSGETIAADARGAGALIDGLRMSRVLNQMSEKEAGRFGIAVDDRFGFFRLNRAKVNMARRGGSSWYRLVSVTIDNGDAAAYEFGDNVQTVAAWAPRDVVGSVTEEHMHAVRAKVAAGSYRRDARAKAWVGTVVAEAVGLDAEGQRAQVEQIIKAWIKAGVLKETERRDPGARRDFTFVEPGEWKG